MNPNKIDVNHSLVTAVRYGRLKRTRKLIHSYGLSHSQAWSERYVLLCLAVKNKRTAVAKLLLTSGSKVNSKKTKLINTPLHFACKNDDIEIVKILLDKGANVNVENQFGRTPLHNAVDNTRIGVTELPLNQRADVNSRDNDDSSSHRVAVDMKGFQIVEHLLNYGADVNCLCTGTLKKGYTPLHFAVETGNKEVVTLLLSRAANVDVKGKDDTTPLHIAAKKGYVHIAEDLLNHGACIHSFTLKEGYTPLHFACELGNEEAVMLFLMKGADVNATTNGKSPLQIATKKGCENVVKLLLQHGATVDNLDKDGKTTLHLAVERENLTIVEDVLRHCPNNNNESNRNSLKIAVLGYGEGYKKIVGALLEYGFTVDPEDANDPYLLLAAVMKGCLKIIEDLLKYGAEVNTPYEGFTPLHIAARYKQAEVAKLLISCGADINAQDENGKTPIFYAIQNADLKMTNLLLTNGASIKESPDLLHIAVKKECIEIVEALLQHDADVYASDTYGRTALHFTALIDYEDRYINASDGCVKPIFQFTASSDYEDCDMNIKGKIAELLLSKGARVDAQTFKGETTLHTAINMGYAKVVEALLKYNANVNSGVESDISPLHFSAHLGNKEITTMLLNKGANVNAKQNDGTTALHIATHEGHNEVVKVLLEHGANVDFKMTSGLTPLHLGAMKGYVEIIETLLKCVANIDSRDDDGRTALHIASHEGHKEVVVTLLEYGSDINITSRIYGTPLDHAVAGLRSFHSQINNCFSGYGYSYTGRGVGARETTAIALERHIVKMKAANLYVSEQNLQSMSRTGEWSGFQDKCEEEIARMKNEKINNRNISFYDILAKGTSSLAICMRNENIVQALKSGDYNVDFPRYASMIEINFRKAMERKKLLEQGNNIFHFLFNHFPKLPYDCIEQILSDLSNEDLRNLMYTCKPLNISTPNTFIGDSVVA